MAIDDNTLYGLTGAQVKDLAEKVEYDGAVPAFAPFDIDGTQSWAGSALYKTIECNSGDEYKFSDLYNILEDGKRVVVVHVLSNGQIRRMIPIDTWWSSDIDSEYGLDGYGFYNATAFVNAKYEWDGSGFDGTTLTYYPGVAYIRQPVNAQGDSTIFPMTQSATTSLIYDDPGAIGLTQKNNRIRIGKDSSTTIDGGISLGKEASTTNGLSIGYQATSNFLGVAIGNQASATARGSIALGARASATTTGEMNIGSTNTADGYGNSNYRLLTGVHDPVNAHDATTKGYVDTLLASSAIKKLSSEDYNYPTSSPDGVALWELGVGVYISDANTKVWFTTSDNTTGEGVYLVTGTNSSYSYNIYRIGAWIDGIWKFTVNKTTGAHIERVEALWSNSITVRGNGAPTTSTVGRVGHFYVDDTNLEAYICVDVTGQTYTWKQITN